MEACQIFRPDSLCWLLLVNKLNDPQMTAASVRVLGVTTEPTFNCKEMNSYGFLSLFEQSYFIPILRRERGSVIAILNLGKPSELAA